MLPRVSVPGTMQDALPTLIISLQRIPFYQDSERLSDLFRTTQLVTESESKFRPVRLQNLWQRAKKSKWPF